MKTNHPKLKVPEDIQKLYDCGPIEESVVFRVPNYHAGQHRMEYSANGPRDYYLWNCTTQTRVESWRKASEMWDHARERVQPVDTDAEAEAALSY